jgi:hypothetical protein
MDPSSQGCPAATGIGFEPVPVNQPVNAAQMNVHSWDWGFAICQVKPN